MISIRPYEPGDLDTGRALWGELIQWHRDLYEDPSLGGENPGILFDHYLSKSKPAGVWVAEYNDLVVGLTGLLLQEDMAEIEPLIVTPGYRYRGVGRSLLEFMIEEAKSRGLPFLSVRPVVRNFQAMACCHSAGFRKLGRIEMVLELAATGLAWKPGISLHHRKYQY